MVKNCENYTAFANVYDSTMQHVPYDRWALLIHRFLTEYNIKKESLVIDVGCGTGKLGSLLRDHFTNLVGIDLALPMIQRALQENRLSSCLQADMSALPIKDNTAEAILCTHDTLNYAKNPTSLQQVISEFARILQQNGILIFDLATVQNAVQNFHQETIEEEHEGYLLHWQNEFNESKQVLHSQITVANDQGEQFVENHIHHFFTENQVTESIEQAGFQVVYHCFDYQLSSSPQENSQLEVYICQLIH